MLLIAMVFISCSKAKDKPDNIETESAPIFRIQRGTAPKDTVYLIRYDEKKRIKSIQYSYNSINYFEYFPTYESAGNLTSLVIRYDDGLRDPITYKYNADNLLTEINMPGRRYVYEYTNGVLSKKSYYAASRADDPTPDSLWRYYTYEVANGNIVSRKEYISTGTRPAREMFFTYTNDKNVFKPLTLINFDNALALAGVGDEEKFFNKNLVASYTQDGEQTKFTYAYNDNHQLTKFVVTKQYKAYSVMLSY